MAKYRMIQWGTGSVGKHSLRTIVERPDFELVGLRVYNPDKVGKDAGELLGGDATGVLATDSVDEILALDADCVAFSPLGSNLEDQGPVIDDICRILASGKNVVSSALEYHAFLRPGVEVPGPADAYERLIAACELGNASYFHGGINPGYAMEIWPLVHSQVCRRIDRMVVTEVVDMRRYASQHMINYIGFGQPTTDSPMDARFQKNRLVSPYSYTMRHLAQNLGIELEDIRYEREVALATEKLEIAAGTIEAGTAAAIKFQLQGYLFGEPRLIFEWVWRVTGDVGTEWPTGDSRWLLHIEGDPTLDAEMDLATSLDAARAVSLTVATVILNAVPATVAAEPGLYNNISIGIHGGGYFVP